MHREVVKLNPQGKYYLDVTAVQEFRNNRREQALMALLITGVILVVVLFFAIQM